MVQRQTPRATHSANSASSGDFRPSCSAAASCSQIPRAAGEKTRALSPHSELGSSDITVRYRNSALQKVCKVTKLG